MGSVTYKNQPAIDATGGSVPVEGTKHIYTVKKILWPEDVSAFIQTLLIPKTLHVCCGRSPLGDMRVDLDPDVKPDMICDATNLPFPDDSYETVLCDPPYNGVFQWNHDLLCELSRVASKRIIFQHWFIPADAEGRWKKWHKFQMNGLYAWQPRTYFGRGQFISVFDAVETYDAPTKFSTHREGDLTSLRAARQQQLRVLDPPLPDQNPPEHPVERTDE